MKTNFITLKNNQSLRELAYCTKRTTDEVRNDIIYKLLNRELVHDIPEFCGESLENILIQNDETLTGFSAFFYKAYSPRFIKILKGIQIWGKDNDCKDCGCEMVEDETENVCSNPVCGCYIQTVFEPDYDTMFGGRDYNNEFRLN